MKSNTIRLATHLGLLACLWVTLAGAQTSTWRPVYLGTDGMVATAHYGSAMAGHKMLAQGGNAIDAAVAAAFTSTVVEPSRAGIGADAFILIYLAEEKEVLFINGGGWAPQRATAEFFRKHGGLQADGPLGPVVPGAPAGLLLASEKYGRLSRDKLLAPAIKLAERGFVVSENLHGVFGRNLSRLLPFPSTRRTWVRDGKPFGMGRVVVQKDLGQTFRRIASKGRDGFYEGTTAERIVEFLGQDGGIMDLADLSEFAAEQAKPLHVNYKGYDVYSVPPPTQGHVMLQALKILEDYDLQAMGHNSADYIHHIAEALKLAFADREAFIGDPRFIKRIPIDELLSSKYAARRRALIKTDRAFDGAPPAGDPRSLKAAGREPLYASGKGSHRVLAGAAAFPGWVDNLTTYIGAVDKDRNMVSITASLAGDFGSGIYVDGEGGGFFINDVMGRFHIDEGHPNQVAPRKRPRQTLNPVLVLKDGKPLMVFGTPGGDTQGQSQLQFFLNFVEFGMNVQQALEQPYAVTNSYSNSMVPHEFKKTLTVSERINTEVRNDLARRGHDVVTHSAKGMGGVNAIVVDSGQGVLMGGAAPATDGYVIGW
ncbi:MAG: gamma-glutamyltransferase [Acidobacteria bacterium]|nr:gamma-glutamyltransferase [Acidobacteriota bacterium]